MKISKKTRRYWWPHPVYREAKRHRYPSLHRWLPCADVTTNYQYHYDEIRDRLWRDECAMMDRKRQIALEAHRPRRIPAHVMELWRPDPESVANE